jgi:hypothetical protein
MCVVEFGDGVALVGEWYPDRDTIHLRIPAYRTTKGTDMEARSWRLEQGKDGVWRSRIGE